MGNSGDDSALDDAGSSRYATIKTSVQEKVEDYESTFESELQNNAICNLIIFSIAMAICPLATMYCLYDFFTSVFHIESSIALVYAAIGAVIVVYTIILLFVRRAYNEEKTVEDYMRMAKNE